MSGAGILRPLIATGVVVLVATLLLGLASVDGGPDPVVVVGGPEGGFFDATARDLVAALEARGIPAELRTREDTLAIVRDVDDPATPADIGFVAQRVDAAALPRTVSLGSIVREPLLAFANTDVEDANDVTDLRGRRIQVGLPGSGVRPLAEAVLGAYGIDGANATFLADGYDAARTAVRAGDADAVFFLYPPDVPVIEAMARDPALELLPIPDAAVVAAQLEIVQPMTIPAGAFDLVERVPPRDVATIGLPVTVVTHEGLPDGAAYAILETLHAAFRGGSLSAAAGTFPAYVDRQLPYADVAARFERDGTPWRYRALPPRLAAAWERIVVIGSLLLAAGTLYKFLGPNLYDVVNDIVRPHRRERFLARLEAKARTGEPLEASERRRLRRMLARAQAAAASRRRLESLSAGAVGGEAAVVARLQADDDAAEPPPEGAPPPDGGGP